MDELKLYHLLCGLIVYFVWPSEALEGIDCAVLGRDQKAKRSQGSTPRVRGKARVVGSGTCVLQPFATVPDPRAAFQWGPRQPFHCHKEKPVHPPSCRPRNQGSGWLERGPSCLSSDCGFTCSLSSFASWLGDGLTRRSISISGGQGWEHPCFRRGGRRGSRAGAASTEQEGSEIRMTPRGLILGKN